MHIDSLINKNSEALSASMTGLDKKQQTRLKDACKDFESVFLSTVLKGMRKTVQKSELFGSDPAQNTFQEMMDDEIGKSAAKSSSLGIADMLYRQLTSDMVKQSSFSQTDSAKGETALSLTSSQGDSK